jgi:hypothetical protein
MAIFKAIEENTLLTEPIARGASTTPICTGIWRATWSTGFMTLEIVAFSCLREPHSASIWWATPFCVARALLRSRPTWKKRRHAARLPSIAEPNYVVIAESTGKLVGNLFELEDVGARNLKGIAGSVCVNEQLERLVAGP